MSVKEFHYKMLKNLGKIFTPDCLVIQLSDSHAVYPIYKNGFTSLEVYAEQHNCKTLTNLEISQLDQIEIFLREPEKRFVSGVHTAIEWNKIDNDDLYLKDVEDMIVYDRHFIPQIYWLFHLFKYFKKKVKISSVTELYDLIPNRDVPKIKKLSAERKQKILSIKYENYIEADQRLIHRYLGKTVELKKIIEEFRYALSKD
jgi:hypothetical protein